MAEIIIRNTFVELADAEVNATADFRPSTCPPRCSGDGVNCTDSDASAECDASTKNVDLDGSPHPFGDVIYLQHPDFSRPRLCTHVLVEYTVTREGNVAISVLLQKVIKIGKNMNAK